MRLNEFSISTFLAGFIAGVLAMAALSIAHAADFEVTTKTKPPVVFFFVVVPAVPEPGVPFIHKYTTDDQQACQADADAWTKWLAPSKVVCLPHKQKLKEPRDAAVPLDPDS